MTVCARVRVPRSSWCESGRSRDELKSQMCSCDKSLVKMVFLLLRDNEELAEPRQCVDRDTHSRVCVSASAQCQRGGGCNSSEQPETVLYKNYNRKSAFIEDIWLSLWFAQA